MARAKDRQAVGGELEITLHRQQARALRCPANEILFGGAAGGGKSHFLRAALITFCMSVPGLQCYLFRRTYPDLVRNHMTGPGAFPEMLAPLTKSGHGQIVRGEIRFPNGSKIHLRHLQNYQDVYSYQGAEFHVLAFDEGGHFTIAEYVYLRGRCRLGGLKIPAGCEWLFPRILIGSNPGNIGHAWLKAGFVDHGPYVVHRAAKDEGGMLRCFIPSRIEDNPTLMANDPDYVERLEGLGDPALVRALKEGDWDVVAGAIFGDVWRRDRHTCDPFPIPHDWDIWVGADDGFVDPTVFIWLTQDPRTGTFYAIDEFWKSGCLPAKVAAEVKEIQAELVRAPRQRGGETELDRGPVTGLMDSAAFADTGQAEISRGDQMKRLGLRIKAVDKWPGSRKDRAQNLHRLLAENPKCPHKLPALRVFKGRCPNLIRTLPILPRDEKKPEQVGDHPDDHCFVAGTMIETPDGRRPIESLQPGDMVMTRLGAWPVLANWKTAGRPVIEIEGLTGTPGHPVWTTNGWKSLYLLTPEDTVCTWQTSKRSATMAPTIAATLIHQNSRTGFIFVLQQMLKLECASIFTAKSTATIMGRFLKVSTSITSTKTLSTIILTTLKLSARKGTLNYICRGKLKSSGRTCERLNRRLLNGIEARLAANGIGNTHSRLLQTLNHGRLRADSAAWNSSQSHVVETTIANQHVRPRLADSPDWTTSKSHVPSVGSCSRPTDIGALNAAQDGAEPSLAIADVFNLTVDGPGEYFANNVLVLNCFDALTYGLQWKKSGIIRAKVTGL